MNAVCSLNGIAIGSGLTVNKDYELVIGGQVSPEIRVVMTKEEHEVVSALLQRAWKVVNENN